MSVKVDLRNINGDVIGAVELPASIFDVELNESLLHGVIKGYRANRRQGTHATKTRSMVSGSGKKPFRQKGTGSARQGSSRSPLMPGGAVLHGPQPRDYREHLNIKQKRLAARVALSEKLRCNRLVLIDDFQMSKYSTKQILKGLKALGCSQNVLLADERKDDYLYRSARNVYKTEALMASQINAEDLLRHEFVVLSSNALQSLQQRLGGQS